MQENPISNSLSKTDSNEASNPIRSLMPFRYGPLCYAIVDVEIGLTDHRIHDIGALRYDGAIFHKASTEELLPFLERVEYLCGHNIIHHDAKYLFEDRQIPWRLVDTLYLSPLLFPERPYHRLVKDDKLLSDQMNNPVNDCEKARDLLLDEMARWDAWPEQKRRLFTALLRNQPEFDGFLDLMGAGLKNCDLREQIATVYRGRICQNVELEPLIEHYPCELAYALALIDTTDHRSITPGWVLHNYPSVEFIIKKLRHTPCALCAVAHQGVTEDLPGLVDANLAALDRLSEDLLSLAAEPVSMDQLCLAYYHKKQLLTTHVEKAALYARNVDAMAEYLVDMGRMEIQVREGLRYFVRT